MSRAAASAPSPNTKPITHPSATTAPDAAVARSQFVDSGTQYSPPDWPPTSSRSTLRVARLTLRTDGWNDQELKPGNEAARPRNTDVSTPGEIVDEPHVRVTPQSSLRNVGGGTRRTRSSVSSREHSPDSSRASPKRVRQYNPNAKVMPKDYTSCDPKDLAALIADMLMELMRYNDEIPLKDGHLTRFHSR